MGLSEVNNIINNKGKFASTDVMLPQYHRHPYIIMMIYWISIYLINGII